MVPRSSLLGGGMSPPLAAVDLYIEQSLENWFWVPKKEGSISLQQQKTTGHYSCTMYYHRFFALPTARATRGRCKVYVVETEAATGACMMLALTLLVLKGNLHSAFRR